MVGGHRDRVLAFWAALYHHDWDQVAASFTSDALYEDVPSPDAGARGPEAIVKRLRLGLDPVDSHVHDLRRLAVDGDLAFTEHTETWGWHTGETVTLPFVSVMELRDGLISRWSDYWDLQTLLGAAPQWWIEHITAEYARDPFDGNQG